MLTFDDYKAKISIIQILEDLGYKQDISKGKAVLHNDDTITHGHSLGLVVGNVDEGGSQLLVQLDDLGTHAGTQLGIQVGQRLSLIHICVCKVAGRQRQLIRRAEQPGCQRADNGQLGGQQQDVYKRQMLPYARRAYPPSPTNCKSTATLP